MAVGPLTTAEVAAIGIAFVVTVVAFVLPLPWLAQAAIAVGLGTLAGTEVARRAVPRDARQALEAFGYLGEWELDRAGDIGAGPIASPVEAQRWLAMTPERPEDRWFRWELLLLVDQPAEAAAVADRIGEATPYDRFERAYALDRIAWGQGGPSDLERLRRAAAEAGPPGTDDRRHAEVAVAVFEAQQLASAGVSPLPPLVAVRDQVPADVGIGRRYVAGLRLVALTAAVFFALVVPAAMTLIGAVLAAG